jgi:hypothetical protein
MNKENQLNFLIDCNNIHNMSKKKPKNKKRKIFLLKTEEIKKKLFKLTKKNSFVFSKFSFSALVPILKTMKEDKYSFFIEYNKIEKILHYYRKNIFPFFELIIDLNKLSLRTFSISVYIFLYHFSSKFLEEKSIKEMLCLTYVTIATKYEESSIIDIDENLNYLAEKKGFKISQEKIKELKKRILIYEGIVLEEIDYNVKVPFLYDLIEIICFVNSVDNKKEMVFNEFVYNYLQFPEKLFCRKNGLFISVKEIFNEIFK